MLNHETHETHEINKMKFRRIFSLKTRFRFFCLPRSISQLTEKTGDFRGKTN